MVMESYCQQLMTFCFGLQLTARLKLQFKSGTPLFKSPCNGLPARMQIRLSPG